LKKGEAIAQMVLLEERFIGTICVEVDGTESVAPIPFKSFRGDAGFGSSGK